MGMDAQSQKELMPSKLRGLRDSFFSHHYLETVLVVPWIWSSKAKQLLLLINKNLAVKISKYSLTKHMENGVL